jgi:hypothetical protein
MSNLAYTRELGVWNPGVIRASELADLDAKTVKAPNFAEGGTYAPSSVVTVGGAGMTLFMVGSNVVSAGSLTIDGTASISIAAGGQLSCFGDALLFGTVDVLAGAWAFSNGTTTTFNAGSLLNVAGAAHFTGAISAVGMGLQDLQVNHNLDVPVGATLNIEGAANFVGSLNAVGVAVQDQQVSGTLSLVGAGAIQERVVVGADFNATYSVSSADLVYIDRNTQTGSHDYTLDQVGVAVGKRIRFSYFNGNSSYNVRLLNSVGPTLLATLGNSALTYAWVDIQYVSGAWKLVAAGRA